MRFCIIGDNRKNITESWKETLRLAFSPALYSTYSETNTSSPDPGWRKIINLNFHFQTSLCCLKRFYESLKEAAKFHFMHYSCVVIILLSTGFYNSVFFIYSFRFLSFCVLVLHVSVSLSFSVFLFYLIGEKKKPGIKLTGLNC